MTTTRDFDAMLAEKGRHRKTFRIGGQEFAIRAKLPYRRFQTLIAAMDRVDGDDEAEVRRAEEDFFRAVLVKADRDRFLELLSAEGDDDDDDSVIDASQVGPLIEWLLEHFTGKQSTSSESSSNGADGTGVPANVVSLNARAS